MSAGLLDRAEQLLLDLRAEMIGREQEELAEEELARLGQ